MLSRRVIINAFAQEDSEGLQKIAPKNKSVDSVGTYLVSEPCGLLVEFRSFSNCLDNAHTPCEWPAKAPMSLGKRSREINSFAISTYGSMTVSSRRHRHGSYKYIYTHTYFDHIHATCPLFVDDGPA